MCPNCALINDGHLLMMHYYEDKLRTVLGNY